MTRGAWTFLLCVSLPYGCTTERIDPRGASDGAGRVINTPAGVSRSTYVRAAVLPLVESIPYDNHSLPLISPDGNYIATEVGVPPRRASLLAMPGAEPPVATSIETFAIDYVGRSAQHVAMLSEPSLLGRAADNLGFLVESPRDDGSRWIGKASWGTGEIQWLVNDENVNAFAALGPRGELAWCRRTPDQQLFDLVVRARGQEWTIPSNGEDWLMPTWSGDKLFVLRLLRGRLDALFLYADSQAAMRQSIGQWQLNIATSGASRESTYQAVTGHPATVLRPQPRQHELVFFHTSDLRVAIWRPLSPRGRLPILLERGSVSAIIDDEDYAIYLARNALVRRRLGDEKDRIELLAGTFVPRMTTSADWPLTLFLVDPETPNSLALASLTLLPPEEGEGSGSAKR